MAKTIAFYIFVLYIFDCCFLSLLFEYLHLFFYCSKFCLFSFPGLPGSAAALPSLFSSHTYLHIYLIMLLALFNLPTFEEATFFGLSFFALVLLVSQLRRFLRSRPSTKTVSSSTAYSSTEATSSWSGLPESEIVTIAEYKAQKHRLLHN